jgi:outer membrane protein TolC
MNKRSVIIQVFSFMLVIVCGKGMAQEPAALSLAEAQKLAADNYPLVRQKDLIRRTSALTVENLQTSFLPQLNFSAQATYQSAVTEVPVKIPAFTPEALSKDQYRALLDINQLIYDGGSLGQQKRLQAWSDKVEQEKVEVEMQKLRETINQVYFSTLLAEEQESLVALVDKDLESGIRRVQAQVDNGTAFRSALASLKSEKLRNMQRRMEWQATRRGLLDVLGLYIGRALPDGVKLSWPEPATDRITETINRSELALLRAQDTLLQERNRQVDVRNRPKLSAFLQGGYGRPGLDMLKNEFSPFYVTGLRFNWGISSLYTSKRDRSILEVQRQVIGVQEDQFLLQTRARLKQQSAEIRKWEKMLPVDDEIIGLREQVREATQAQLDNGVADANDYIREVNAADQARLQKLLHRLQWIQAIVQYQTIAGQNIE